MTHSRPVYSSTFGRICPDCGKPVNSCVCRLSSSKAKNKRGFQDDGIIRIIRETKGRGGKTVTIISNIQSHDIQLKELAKQLRERCSAGGTVKENEIVIQGDHRQVILEELLKQGYKAKFSGG